MQDFREMETEKIVKYIKARRAANAETKQLMETGIRYYRGEHDIQNKKRMAAGKDGRLVEVLNLPNARITDNQYAKAVDQKTNYLFSQTPIVTSEDGRYAKAFGGLLNKAFLRTINKIARESYNCGIAWAYVSLKDDGKILKIKKLDSPEIIPDWEDNSHESLRAVIRIYQTEEFSKDKLKTVTMCEMYTVDEVITFRIEDGDRYELITRETYLQSGENKYSWDKIPLIYFKSNESEIPLIIRVKSLQDAINTILSNFQDNMLEDARTTVLVVKNYSGEDAADLRSKIAATGIIGVETVDSVPGGVDTLHIEVNSDNYKLMLQILKDKLIENACALDIKQEKGSTAPNEMNIKSMYSDMELDANGTELEYQASFEYLQFFFKKVSGFSEDLVADVTFKRNIMVNEAETVKTIKDSVGILSEETLIANHPFVDDAAEELKRLEKERETIDGYNEHFGGDDDIDDILEKAAPDTGGVEKQGKQGTSKSTGKGTPQKPTKH